MPSINKPHLVFKTTHQAAIPVPTEQVRKLKFKQVVHCAPTLQI